MAAKQPTVSSHNPTTRLPAGEIKAITNQEFGIRSNGPSIEGSSRLTDLLTRLDTLMSERYAFDVFAKNSVNFGIMLTYRQTWKPQTYQVGDLVKTIPLQPKEVCRYTSRQVTKKTRATKELEDNLHTRRTESSDTSRVEAEIIEKSQKRSNFKITASESIGNDESYDIKSTQELGGDQSKASEQTKKEFRESVLKAAQEYRQQHRIEVDTTESLEAEESTFREIQNPNDELAVTYLFYELQRTYNISERIHRIVPVVLVANEVPAPNEIDDAWLLKHDWILRRTILDDSFRPALEYLVKSFVGAEVNIRILESNAEAQKAIVGALKQQIELQGGILKKDQQDVLAAVRTLGSAGQQQGMIDIVSRIFDPIGITGQKDIGAVSAAQAMVDYAKETRDRAEREKARLLSQIEVATTALQNAIDKLTRAVKEHYDNVTAVDRLRIHVKDNILYYMQAIWSHEPPDQRFFRLYNIDVPTIAADTAGKSAQVRWSDDEIWDLLEGTKTFSISLPLPNVTIEWKKKLVEVADIDRLLGYKGNYMIFPLKENNYLTFYMMQDYLQVGDDLLVRDPDGVGSRSLEEIQKLIRCLFERDPETYYKRRTELKQLLASRMRTPGSELTVVPTTSLYIEALVGTHPLLEDFKLIHRALDVKKVQAEVRRAELENIRLAARALEGERGDPDIEKKIVIEGDAAGVIANS